ncbi:MAG: alpha/beta hydrolase [Lapillicoccus sp.]
MEPSRAWVTDERVEVEGRTWAVRQSGDPLGRPVVYFHGTPSSRLEPAFADAAAADLGIRLVAFDRPGYGGSSPGAFDLTSLAASTGNLADRLAVERFGVLGQSGGGPFALACGAVLGDRVTRVGVCGGAVPFQLMPGALDLLDDNDIAAVALLPDRIAAAAGFARGFEPFREMLRAGDQQVLNGFRQRCSPRDRVVLDRAGVGATLVAAFRASMAQGTDGAGWDNAAWVGPWDIDLGAVRRPVDLWYGGEDPFAPVGAGPWLAEHLPDATLHPRSHDGHLGVIEHTREILGALLAD